MGRIFLNIKILKVEVVHIYVKLEMNWAHNKIEYDYITDSPLIN